MNFYLKDKTENRPEAEEFIFINGVKVGELITRSKSSGGNTYHANFKLAIDHCYLIQGFASTKEEAIAKAIENGKRIATDALSEIYKLEIKLNGGTNE